MATLLMTNQNRNRAYTGCFVLILILLATASSTAIEKRKEQTMQLIANLQSRDARIRDHAVDAMLDERKSQVEALIPLIDPANADRYSDETRSAAAYLLGELRAIEAVPVLAKALADEPGPKIIFDLSRYDVPVFTALVKIGRPAVPAMIENIENSENAILQKNSLDVLIHVLGGKRRLLELLLKVHERAADPVDRRIAEARTWAEAHYKEDKEPLY